MNESTNKIQATWLVVLVMFGLLMLVFGLSRLLASQPATLDSSPVWFIGLLIISGASLAFIAVVFRSLGLQAPSEAFALPSGSIRTLLAIGVMVLFAVFGLAAISTGEREQRPAAEPMATAANVSGDANAVKAEIERYRVLNIVAVPAKTVASDTSLALYRLESSKSKEAIDLTNQIIPALLTLLTSVISFYFGSRNVEAARDAKSNKGDAVQAPPESLQADFRALDTALSDVRKRIGALGNGKATAGNEKELAEKLSKARSDLIQAEASRSKIDTDLKGVAAGTATVESLSGSLAALKAMLASLEALLKQVEALV